MGDVDKQDFIKTLFDGDAIARLREARPRVHCITNLAANNFTANVLLALGAIPSLTVSPEEVPDFTSRSDALLINLGTLNAERKDAINTAVEVANETRKPWVLDPAFAEASTTRLEFAAELLDMAPHCIRANAIEIASLCRAVEAEASAEALALATHSCVAATGEADTVTDGVSTFTVSGGDPVMARVTAVGCVTSAVVAAFLAIEQDALKASLLGLALVASAGEAAAKASSGPGSFVPAFLDAIYAIDDKGLKRQARIS